MRKDLFSYRPELTKLESRCQPGSMLTPRLDNLLVAGGILGLDLQDLQPQQGALVRSNAAAQPATIETPATIQTGNPTPAVLPAQLDDQGVFSGLGQDRLTNIDMQENINGLRVVPSERQSHITVHEVPLPNRTVPGSDPCELPGNVIQNGSFETGDFSGGWQVQIGGDPYVNVVPGGADLGHDGFELSLGTVGGTNTIVQNVTTDPTLVYSAFVSVAHDGGGPQFFQIQFNGVPILDLNADPYGTNSFPYTRFEIDGITTNGLDSFAIVERQDPAFYHEDNNCLVPNG